jgi:hypothetical protein
MTAQQVRIQRISTAPADWRDFIGDEQNRERFIT